VGIDFGSWLSRLICKVEILLVFIYLFICDVFDLVDSIYGEETCLSMPYFTASEKALSAVCCIFGHLKRLQPRRRPKKNI
jgi:hypothetical protein